MYLKEIFPIDGALTKYYIHRTGYVLSTYVDKNSRIIPIGGVNYSLRKMNTDSSGYLTVTIRHKKYSVHRLVANAFLEKDADPDRKYVNHRDGNKSNNDVGNLEWVTASENVRHAIKLGLRKTNSQHYITRTVCDRCERPMSYMWCKTEDYDDRIVRYKQHTKAKVIKISRRPK